MAKQWSQCICCKRIKRDDGIWEKPELFRPEAPVELRPNYCPACSLRKYARFYSQGDTEKPKPKSSITKRPGFIVFLIDIFTARTPGADTV